MFQWLRNILDALREPQADWDSDYPDSNPRIPSDFGADTQPTSPGALDSDHGRLK